ncbi:sodium:alanine symporter family protein [candidate division KSB1 bacterium]|nr:sodium:alanine symporter family protein [candidate division KSB1 bacterium]
MESIAWLVAKLDSFLWGLPLIIVLLGTHVFLTIRLRFPQRYIWKGIKLSLAKDQDSEGDVSQFGALTTALAATIGTGNIVGVATAIALGGPGAVFWLWLTGVFGIATKYSEALLAVKYRIKTSNGTMAGGPMYVLEIGMQRRGLGMAFALFTAVAAFGIGCMVQSNAISTLAYDTLNLPHWITGLVLSILTAVVILGGIKSIAAVCGRLVPLMAFFYVLGCIIILIMHYETIPASLLLIVKSAFTGHAAVGGFAGAGMMMALRFGVARGLFSNESGLGSAPIVAAAAQTRNPVRQALVSSTGTFWDTVVVCLITGLVIINSGDWQGGANGAILTRSAFSHIPYVGPIILTVGLLTFVFSTILGWSYYGEKSIEYLRGAKAVLPYRVMWCFAVFLGSMFSLQFVWDFADLANGLMALPNILALLFLSGVLVAETRKYLWEDEEV